MRRRWKPNNGAAGADWALDRFWERVVRGEGPAPDDTLDPGAAATIRQLHGRDDTPDPTPSFTNRLLEDLMDSTTLSTTLTRPVGLGRFTPNGRATPAWRPPTRTLPHQRRGWAIGQLATAAMLLLTLVGSYVIFGSEFRGLQNELPPPADVPMYRGSATRTGEMPGPGPAATPVELWRVEVGVGVHSAPAIVGGVLFLGADDGEVYALDHRDGTERWRFAAGGAASSSPAVAHGLVYVGAEDGVLYALDQATGTERWRFAAARAFAGPAVVGDLVVTGGVDGVLVGLDARTGTERWRAQLGAAVSRSPAVADGVVYIGADDGNLYAVDATTGAERWRFQTGYDGVGTAAVAGGMIFVSARNVDDDVGTLYAVDAARGVMVWRFRTPTTRAFAPPAVSGDRVVAGSTDGFVYGLDTADGAVAWTYEAGADHITAAPAVAGGAVYIGSRDGGLHALDLATGAAIWRIQAAGSIDFGPVVTGGVAYFGTESGIVQALGAGAAAGAAATPADATPADATPAPAAGLAEFVWRTTGGPDGLSSPNDLAFDPEGRLWVNDGTGRFHIFDTDGDFLETWGAPGSGEGQFNFAEPDGDVYGGVAFAADGGFYVLDTGNQRVQQFAPDRSFVRAWGGVGRGDGQFLVPLSIAAGPDGALYVLDDRRVDVQVFAPDGTFLRSFAVHPDARPPGTTNDLFVDGEGNVYVATHFPYTVTKFDPSGRFVATIGDGEFEDQSGGLAVDAAGRIYAAVTPSGNRVLVFEPDGSYIGSWGSTGLGEGQFLSPFTVALDGDGHAYVSDGVGNTVQKFRLLPPLAPVGTPAP